MIAPTNIILIISDTLRTAELGCYGNTAVRTSNIDALAQRSARFTRAYPESLPTIPVRRALHTGRRCYPFNDYKSLKWDIVCLAGWQAMSNEEDTLAENLADAGYHTGFITDSLPYFAPGLNFQRGFWQWEYIRGQQQDRWRSPYSVPAERLARYDVSMGFGSSVYGLVPMHLANTANVKGEEDTTTAQVFSSAMKFLEDNRSGQPFYLLIDCFDPHEPWEAPESYYHLYGDPDYAGRRILHCGYGPADILGYTDEEIAYVYAHYCGLITLFDTWLGKFLTKLEALGLMDNTAILFASDHGTNFCDNPRKIIGKPDNAMYPGVMHLPFLVRLPGDIGAGTTCDALVYNLDMTATIYDLAGISSPQGIDGQSVRPLISGKGSWKTREYVTCRYNHSLCYIDDGSWILMDIDGCPTEIFDLKTDPECRHDLSAKVPERAKVAWNRLLQDAGGTLPNYLAERQTDAIGEAIVTE